MASKARASSGTGIARSTANVALTAARAVTSHARKRYHERYRGRYRFAWAVFAFDTALLALALGLLVLNIFLFGNGFGRPTGLDLALRRGEIISGALTPIEAVVRSVDGERHEDVRLTWDLPSWVEVMRADPALVRGSVRLGSIAPGGEAVSRLYIRVRAVPGAHLPIRFLLREGTLFNERTGNGEDVLSVNSSALTAEPALPIDAVEPGASIPIIVSNQSSIAAPAVILRLLTKDGAPVSSFGSADDYVLGTLEPGERHVVFLDVDPSTHGRIDYIWELQDASRAVFRRALTLTAADPVPVTFRAPLRSTPGAGSTDILYHADRPAALLVFHALQATTTHDAARSYDLAQGDGVVHIPLNADLRTTDTIWWVIPYDVRDGKTVIGKRETGVLSTGFPFQSSARYFGPSGDQLGIGPLPPKVGETTSYWIVWSLGPTDADLKDIALSGELGPNVRTTGRYASIIPGAFRAEGSRVSWDIPSLPTTGHDPVTFAFEVLFTPTANQRGTVPILVEKSEARAVEVRSGLELESGDGIEDANLFDDVQARGKGKVE
jgi:hypothetical protein